MCFRPEDEHGPSGGPEILPPAGSRYADVDDSLGPHQRVAADFELQLLVAIAAAGGVVCVDSERDGDAMGIPEADAL